MKSKKIGQVWIETVIYTLIAFIIMGAVLAFVKPQIEKIQDKVLVNRALETLEVIDATVLSTSQLSKSSRTPIELSLKKGTLYINSEDDKIYIDVPSSFEYSDPNQIYDTKRRNIEVITFKEGSNYRVRIQKSYEDSYDIVYDDQINVEGKIEASPTIQRLSVENNGADPTSNKIQLNFKLG